MTSAIGVVQEPLSPRRKAILVGASRGFGAALAAVLAREGYDLALLSRDQEALEALASSLSRNSDAHVRTYVHDVSDHGQVAELFERITRELGGLDLLIYNAGIMDKQGVAAFDPDRDLAMLEVNLLGAVPWLLLAGYRFQKAGAGHLVGVGSVAGERGRALIPAYSASKAGLHTYLEALRNRLERHGVVVTTLKPGQIKTQMLDNAARVRGPISPERAAELAWNAIRSNKRIAYLPARWKLVGLVIRNIPSLIFRRLNL